MRPRNKTRQQSIRQTVRKSVRASAPAVTQFEQLENRRLFAVTASFSAGTLSVFADNLDNTIEVGRNAIRLLAACNEVDPGILSL